MTKKKAVVSFPNKFFYQVSSTPNQHTNSSHTPPLSPIVVKESHIYIFIVCHQEPVSKSRFVGYYHFPSDDEVHLVVFAQYCRNVTRILLRIMNSEEIAVTSLTRYRYNSCNKHLHHRLPSDTPHITHKPSP